MFHEKKAKETFQAGFQYLIAYLQMNKLDIILAKEFLW